MKDYIKWVVSILLNAVFHNTAYNIGYMFTGCVNEPFNNLEGGSLK